MYSPWAGPIARVWARLEARVSAYPAPLRASAERHFAGIGAADRAYFSLPASPPLLALPLMAADDAGLDAELLLGDLEATALAYFAVRIVDNLVDEPSGRGDASLLLLADAYRWDAFAGFAQVPHPEFGAAARDAWLRYAAWTEAERAHIAARSAYAEADFVAHAEKVALAEIPLLAALARAGRWDRAAAVRPLVHRLGVAYGRANDVFGHDRDLRSGAETFLLARVRASVDPPLHDAGVRAALQADPWLDDALAAAEVDHRSCLPLAAEVGLAGFDAWTERRMTYLREARARLVALRLAAALATA